MIEMEDVDAAAGAAGVEDDGVGAGGFLDGGYFPVNEGVASDGLVRDAGRHDVEDEGDEEKRDRHDEQRPPEPVDLVGEGLLAAGALQHFAGLELRRVLVGGVRRRRVAAGLAVEELSGGRRPVADLTVGGGGGRRLQLGVLGLILN